MGALMKSLRLIVGLLLVLPAVRSSAAGDADAKTVRVFIFAGQSNMVGSDSKAKDVGKFPPFAGLDAPQEKVMFSYNLGREEKEEKGEEFFHRRKFRFVVLSHTHTQIGRS